MVAAATQYTKNGDVHLAYQVIGDGPVDLVMVAVHIGARVVKEAQPGEVLVSSTVKDLVAGSNIDFTERKTVELKGVPGEWKLYAAER